MIKCNLYYSVCVLTIIQLSLARRILNQNFNILFINNFKCSNNNVLLSYLNNLNSVNRQIYNKHVKDYTLNDYSVLYAKNNNKGYVEPELTDEVVEKLPEELEDEDDVDLDDELAAEDVNGLEDELDQESNGESEQELKEDQASEKLFGDLPLSNNMVNSVLSLTSSLFRPNFAKILPILYIIKDEVLNMPAQIPSEVKNEDNNQFRMKKVNGLFINNDKGEIENLLLSIPTSQLKRLTESTKFKADVQIAESPVQFMSLGRGFLTKVYKLVIYPYLSQICENTFDTKLDSKVGFMDYLASIKDKGCQSYEEFDTSQLTEFSYDEFYKIFKNVRIRHKSKFDTGVFTKEILSSLAHITKCVKDLAYFNSCIILLQQILGRKPTDLEILYSFLPDDAEKAHENQNNQEPEGVASSPYENLDESQQVQYEANEELEDPSGQLDEQPDQSEYTRLRNKLVDIINYSEREIHHRIEAFFAPFADVAITSLKSKLKKDNRYYRMMGGCLDAGIKGMRTRMFVVHPRIVNLLKKKFILQLFKICYGVVKTSAIKQSLPLHLQLGTLRLARKALRLHSHLAHLREHVVYQYKNDPRAYKKMDVGKIVEVLGQMNRNVIPIEEEVYREYLSKMVELEQFFDKNPGDKLATDHMKRLQQEQVLKETAAKILNSTPDAIQEAIDAYRTKEVAPTDKIPSIMKRRGIKTDPMYKTEFFGDLEPDPSHDDRSFEVYYVGEIYKRTMRKLAMEAIDDRLARLLFMSRSQLLLNHRPNYEQLIEHLKIPRRTADFIVFTATLRCKEYEVWRLKLSLPPYVAKGSRSASKAEHSANFYKTSKSDPYKFNWRLHRPSPDGDPKRSRPSSKRLRRAVVNTHRRMNTIKPNLSSVDDLLMNYKKNFKEYERILQRSPIYRLCNSEHSQAIVPLL